MRIVEHTNGVGKALRSRSPQRHLSTYRWPLSLNRSFPERDSDVAHLIAYFEALHVPNDLGTTILRLGRYGDQRGAIAVVGLSAQ